MLQKRENVRCRWKAHGDCSDCDYLIKECKRCYRPSIALNRKAASKFDCDGRIEFLIIAESPPCPRDKDEVPYIYRLYEHRAPPSPLLANTIKALEGACGKRALRTKKEKLEYLESKGVFFIDTCVYPVNLLPCHCRIQALDESVGDLRTRLVKLKKGGYPKNIVIVTENAFASARESVRLAGLRKRRRNDYRIPFPGNKPHRKKRAIMVLSMHFLVEHARLWAILPLRERFGTQLGSGSPSGRPSGRLTLTD